MVEGGCPKAAVKTLLDEVPRGELPDLLGVLVHEDESGILDAAVDIDCRATGFPQSRCHRRTPDAGDEAVEPAEVAG